MGNAWPNHWYSRSNETIHTTTIWSVWASKKTKPLAGLTCCIWACCKCLSEATSRDDSKDSKAHYVTMLHLSWIRKKHSQGVEIWKGQPPCPKSRDCSFPAMPRHISRICSAWAHAWMDQASHELQRCENWNSLVSIISISYFFWISLERLLGVASLPDFISFGSPSCRICSKSICRCCSSLRRLRINQVSSVNHDVKASLSYDNHAFGRVYTFEIRDR